jgi:hypothetical protein
VSLLVAGGFAAVTIVVITSPGKSFEHPDGFTPGVRVIAVVGCAIATLTFGAFALAGLRVALIIDERGLVIRNPRRTKVVGWDAKPKFEVDNRQQTVEITTPAAGGGLNTNRTTYRYREITCVLRDDSIWMAATSRMRNGERVDQLLRELEEAARRYGLKPDAARSGGSPRLGGSQGEGRSTHPPH